MHNTSSLINLLCKSNIFLYVQINILFSLLLTVRLLQDESGPWLTVSLSWHNRGAASRRTELKRQLNPSFQAELYSKPTETNKKHFKRLDRNVQHIVKNFHRWTKYFHRIVQYFHSWTKYFHQIVKYFHRWTLILPTMDKKLPSLDTSTPNDCQNTGFGIVKSWV